MRDMDRKRAVDRERIRRLTEGADEAFERERDLKKKVRELTKTLEPLREAELHRQAQAAELESAIAKAPAARWAHVRKPPTKGPGVPVLFLSDLHMNETIVGSQVLGANSYSPEVAQARLRECFETAVDLGTNHMVHPEYNGCVVPVAGDLLDVLQGYMHTSERQSMPGLDAAALVADALEPGFRLMADAFGTVYSPWVTGNHGRLTKDMPFQDRTAKSLDAAVYYILEGRLRTDKRFHFAMAPGPRMVFSVYEGTPSEYRYLLLHGDPASGMPRGGDSEAGTPALVARGVKRLRSLHMQLGLPFDTALIGHFHQYMVLPGAIVNGSLKGYDEYASGRAFPFEPPRQAFWFTHPKYGITCSWPIYVGKSEARKP